MVQTLKSTERVLLSDPGMGILRHVDAGYDEAVAVVRMRCPGSRPRYGRLHPASYITLTMSDAFQVRSEADLVGLIEDGCVASRGNNYLGLDHGQSGTRTQMSASMSRVEVAPPALVESYPLPLLGHVGEELRP